MPLPLARRGMSASWCGLAVLLADAGGAEETWAAADKPGLGWLGHCRLVPSKLCDVTDCPVPRRLGTLICAVDDAPVARVAINLPYGAHRVPPSGWLMLPAPGGCLGRGSAVGIIAAGGWIAPMRIY